MHSSQDRARRCRRTKRRGISCTTAWRGFRDGRLPVRAEQIATGAVIVHEEEASAAAMALYACVSSHAQKAQLTVQLGRLWEYASREKLIVVALCRRHRVGLEWPSPKTHEGAERQGRLGNRRLWQSTSLAIDVLAIVVSAIVVEHRDRLTRFGVAGKSRPAILQAATGPAPMGRLVVRVRHAQLHLHGYGRSRPRSTRSISHTSPGW
jgi:predicted site-specific integrase-resolvase